MRGTHLALTLASVALAACSQGSGVGQQTSASLSAQERMALGDLSPAVLPAPPADVSNKYADDPGAAALGKRFFFETAFSGKLLDGDDDGSENTLGRQGEAGKVACAGCHVPSAGFLDNRTLGQEISLAAGWGRRRTPSLLDVGQAKLLMWDGRHDALYNQPFGPIESPVEMNSSRLFVAEQVFALYRADYEAVFGPLPPLDNAARFPKLDAARTGCQPSTVDPDTTCNGTKHGMPGDGAEFDSLTSVDQDAVTQVVVNVGKALGAYERLLDCGPSRFDSWMAGNQNALSAAEQRGAALFVGRGKCSACHSGPYFSDQKFHNVGLQPGTVAVVFNDQGDQGAIAGLGAALTDPLNVSGKFSDGDDQRLPAAVDTSMLGAFRTPSLRCSSRRPTFMHTGQIKGLANAVAFFVQGGNAFGYPGMNELTPLELTEQDQADLVAFISALDGPGPNAQLLSAAQ